MQTDRLFKIVYLLLDRGSITAAELAARFEVSKRTILRDVDALAAAGIPICTTQGKGGGISLMDGFVLNKTALTESEQNEILMALQSLDAVNYPNNALSKLSVLFRRDVADWIEMDFSRWGQRTLENERFACLKNAILSCTAMEFKYVSSYGETTRRNVYPLRLVFKSKAWYLQGFCTDKQDYRTFKLNRILHLSSTDESFSRENYSPPAIEDAQTTPESLVAVELLFAPHYAYRAYDEFDAGCIERSDDGSLYVRAGLPEDAWLYGFLRSLGSGVEVLSPPRVKENLLRMQI